MFVIDAHPTKTTRIQRNKVVSVTMTINASGCSRTKNWSAEHSGSCCLHSTLGTQHVTLNQFFRGHIPPASKLNVLPPKLGTTVALTHCGLPPKQSHSQEVGVC